MTYPKSDPRKLKPIVKQLDSLVRQILLVRDKACVLCGEFRYHLLEVGHYEKRRFKAVRWDLRNCNILCHACNQRDEIEHYHYKDWMTEAHGVNIHAALYSIRDNLVKPYLQHTIYRELQEVAKQFWIHAPDLPLTK
jgi:hypothetical protein